MKVLSKHYKRTMDDCIKDYKNNITKKLVNFRFTNLKDYWRLLNGSRRDEKSAVSIDDKFKGYEWGLWKSNIDNPDFILNALTDTCMYDDS